MNVCQKIVLALALGMSVFAHSEVDTRPNPYKCWEKARILRGALGDSQTGRVVGYCVVKCGKASRQGCASVSLTLVPIAGSSKRYPAKKVKIYNGADASYEVNWSDKYVLELNKDGTFIGGPIGPSNPKNTLVRDVWSATVGGVLESGMHVLSLPYWYQDSEDSFIKPVAGSEKAFLEEAKCLKKYGGQVTTSHALNLGAVPFYAGGTQWTFMPGDNNWNFRIAYVPLTGVFRGTISTVLAPFDVSASQAQSIRFDRRTVQLSVFGYVVDGQLCGRAKYRRFDTIVSGN